MGLHSKQLYPLRADAEIGSATWVVGFLIEHVRYRYVRKGRPAIGHLDWARSE